MGGKPIQSINFKEKLHLSCGYLGLVWLHCDRKNFIGVSVIKSFLLKPYAQPVQPQELDLGPFINDVKLGISQGEGGCVQGREKIRRSLMGYPHKSSYKSPKDLWFIYSCFSPFLASHLELESSDDLQPLALFTLILQQRQ